MLIWQKNLFEYYFLNIFFSDLKFEYYCEYYPEILLQVIGGAMKYIPKKLRGQEVFRSMVSWATKFAFKNS